MIGANSIEKSCVLVFNENTMFDDDYDLIPVFSTLCAEDNGFGSSIAVINNDVYIGYELYNAPNGVVGAVVVFQNYLYVNVQSNLDNGSGESTNENGETEIKDEDDYTIKIEDTPLHHSSSTKNTTTKAITVSIASLAFIAAIYCIYLAKYNYSNKHELLDNENDSVPGDKWNEKMHEQEALNITKEIV